MQKKTNKSLFIRASVSSIAIATIAISGLNFNNTFAADAPYNIVYEGGTELQNNVNVGMSEQEKIKKVDGLLPIISKENRKETVFSNSTTWKDGYMQLSEECTPVKYITAWQDTAPNGISFTIPSNRYSAKITINNIKITDLTGLAEDNQVAIGVLPDNGSIQVRRTVYKTKECDNSAKAEGVGGFSFSSGGYVFLETDVQLIENNSNKVFTSDELYFGILDIDSSQSFKLLNLNLSSSNMFAQSPNKLQPSGDNRKNMFVEDTTNGNYIYSQSNDEGGFNIADGADVFINIPADKQPEGLKYVMGYHQPAGNNIAYYSKIYVVKYLSDANGQITGINREDVLSGENPQGSTQKPNENYELDYWIADTDVTLENGDKIPAGKIITEEQIKQVVVHENITFTAIHKTIFKAPETGAFTNNGDMVIIAGGSLIAVLPILAIAHYIYNRKKHLVKFD